MTHEYTILTGGVVLAAVEGCEAPTAIAWALDTILAVGSDAEVLAISRGDSRMASLRGGIVSAAERSASLEPGAPADFAVLDPATRAPLAEVRGGRIVTGAIEGLRPGLDACLPEP